MTAPATLRRHLTLLRAWHAWLAGAFLVAWLTGGEDHYAMHQFAGYAVLAAVAVRLAAGLLVAAPSPLRLPRPSVRATRQWLATRVGRHPLLAGFAAALLALVGLTALTGFLADGIGAIEPVHEALAELSLWLIAGHVAFVVWLYGARPWITRARIARATARFAAAPRESVR